MSANTPAELAARIAAKKATMKVRAANRKTATAKVVATRQAARAELSDIKQLAKLLRRPGNSLREMTRLFWRVINACPKGGYSEAEKSILTAVAERIFPEGEYVLAA